MKKTGVCPLTPQQIAALRTAGRAALMRVGDEFKPLCQLSSRAFSRADVEALLALGYLRWRNKISDFIEITWSGRARLDLADVRTRNSLRFAVLLADMKRSNAD